MHHSELILAWISLFNYTYWRTSSGYTELIRNHVPVQVFQLARPIGGLLHQRLASSSNIRRMYKSRLWTGGRIRKQRAGNLGLDVKELSSRWNISKICRSCKAEFQDPGLTAVTNISYTKLQYSILKYILQKTLLPINIKFLPIFILNKKHMTYNAMQ